MGENNENRKPKYVYTSDEKAGLLEFIEDAFGEIDAIAGERVSPDIELNLAIIKPTEDLPCYTVVTCGAGAYSMNVPKELEDITNTAEAPYTVSQAINFIANSDKYDLSKAVYVQGTVLAEDLAIDATEFGNATYTISDGTENLIIYRGKYLNNAKFTSEDQLKAGDEVIVYGKLVNYEGKSEMTSGNYIYSLNGVTDGISNIEVAKSNVIYDLSGRRVEKAVKGIYIVNGKKVVK